MRTTGKLTARTVDSLHEPGRYGDGAGLYLQISKWGTKAWVLRYQFNGRMRHMGLGALHDVPLAVARERAREYRGQLAADVDPLQARHEKRLASKAEEAKLLTFKQAAEQYIEAQKPGWRNLKHADQWTASLRTYAYPVIGGLSVAVIDLAHVLKVLNPIWATKTETASRVRGRIEAILDWATASEYRTGENPARWKGLLDKKLPKKKKVAKVRHQPAMPFEDVPAFMGELKQRASIPARALELTILTAVRTGEAIGARWDEIDLAKKLWIIPADRTKAEREHRVPLSERAVEILNALPREKGSLYIFPGGRARRQISNMAMLDLLRGMPEGEGLTVHGFRSSFRDWAGEQTAFPREVAEAALGHVIGDATEAAYRRGDALEKRRRLMDAWAGYCARPVAVGGDVVPIQGKK